MFNPLAFTMEANQAAALPDCACDCTGGPGTGTCGVGCPCGCTGGGGGCGSLPPTGA